MRSPSSLMVAAALLLVPALSHAQLTNGGFEPAAPAGYALLVGGSTSIPGWTTTDSGAEWFPPTAYGYVNSPNGGHIVDLACYTYSAGGVKQTFATIPGMTYVVTFYLGTHAVSGRDGTCSIVVSADATNQTYSHTSLTAQIGWVSQTFSFVADDASATLMFRCLQNANLHFAYIDGAGVSMPVGVEATTWGLVKSLYR